MICDAVSEPKFILAVEPGTVERIIAFVLPGKIEPKPPIACIAPIL